VEEPAIVVGQITKAHGVRGEVAVRNRSDNPDRWTPGAVVHGPDGRALTVATVRASGDHMVVSFEGIVDRDAADAMRGAELTVPAAWLPELAEGEWWPHQLEGCVVRTDDDRDIGILREVVFNPANDIWVVVADDGTETLVPVLDWLLVDVDMDARRIVVKRVPGLTVADDDDAAGEPA
jgi:16S rRNA processing protein RimM